MHSRRRRSECGARTASMYPCVTPCTRCRLGADGEARGALVDLCKTVHRLAEDEAALGRASNATHSYVNSVSFVDFLRTFVRLQVARTAELDLLVSKLRVRFQRVTVLGR